MCSLTEKMLFAVLELQWTLKWKIVHIDMTDRPRPRHGHKYTEYNDEAYIY